MLYTGLMVRLRLLVPTSASRAISAAAELLVCHLFVSRLLISELAEVIFIMCLPVFLLVQCCTLGEYKLDYFALLCTTYAMYDV